MQNHKLVQILKTFSREEYSEFEKFVSSPFHNNGRNFLAFVKELKKYYPAFDSKNLTKENLFRKLYPNSKVSGSLMNTTLSRVLKMAREYLIYGSYLKREVNSNYDYILQLLYRQLYEPAEKELKEYSKMIASYEGISDEFFEGKMNYEILKVQLGFKTNRSQPTQHPAIKLVEYHIRYNMMRLAYFIHGLRANEMMFSSAHEKSLILKYLESLNLKSFYEGLKNQKDDDAFNEITLIYVLWILTITDSKNETHYHEMKELVLKNINRFHHHEKYNLYQALEAACWYLVAEVDKPKYDREMYEVLRSRFENGILSPDKKSMRLIMYRAFLISFLNHADLQFQQHFVDTCIPMLPEEHRENMYNYTMAYIYFKKGGLNKALEFNSRVNFEMFAFRYDTRILQFEIYYELGYFNEAYSLIDTHKHFITNNKAVSAYYREMNTNFLNFYSDLLKAKEGRKKLNVSAFKDTVSKTNVVFHQKWLLDKAGELSKKR